MMARGLSFVLCAQSVSGMRVSNVEVDSKLQQEPCMNPKFVAGPQTNIGYGSSLVQPMLPDGKLLSTSMPAMTFNITQSYDVNMNIVQTFTTFAPREESTVVLNWDAGTISTRKKSWWTQYGDPEVSCQSGPLPPQMMAVSKDMLMAYAALSASMLECVEKVCEKKDCQDKYAMTFPPEFLPGGFAMDLPFEFNYTLTASQDGLLRSERMSQVVMNAPGAPYQKTLVTSNMDYPEGSLGGVTAKDLAVVETWGECQEMDTGDSYVDLALKLRSDKVPVVGLMHQLLDAARVVENQGLSTALAAGQAMKEMMGGYGGMR